MHVFGTNQNMRINQKIRKRLFSILERNNILKETIRYLQPPKKRETNRNNMSQEKFDLIFKEYQSLVIRYR